MKKLLIMTLVLSSLLFQSLAEVSGEHTDGDEPVQEGAMDFEAMYEELPETEADRLPETTEAEEADPEPSADDVPEGKPETESEENLPEMEPTAEFPEAEITAQEDPAASETDPEAEPETEEPETMFFLDESQAEHLTAADEASEELIQEIEEGNVIGLVSVAEPPVTQDADILVETMSSEVMAAALEPDYYYIKNGTRIYCDEVWTAANDYIGGNSTRMATVYRLITYVDSEGVSRKAPIYCLNAMKGSIGDGVIESEAVKALSSTTLRKILYYGYGGPGDICSTYDPSCSHIDWTKWQNRFVFTHVALSKTYSSDVGGATAAELEHVGINRFLTKIQSMPVPSHNNTKLTTPNKANETVTGTSLNSYLVLHSKRAASATYLKDTFQNGYYISRLIAVSDSSAASNGISVTRKSSDQWQLLYWTSADDYKERGESDPRVGPDSGTVNLKAGGRMRFVFPKSMISSRTFTFSMLLKPVSFLLVDTSEQFNSTAYQDYGAYAYQGTQGTLRLTLESQPQGTLLLTKKDSRTSGGVADAVYGLYAAEDLYSGNVLVYKKDTKVLSGTTNSSGQIRFSALIPGKYYVKETTSPESYLKDSTSHSVTVRANVTDSSKTEASLTVKDTPVLKGSISIEKADETTGDSLTGAEFVLYEWSASSAAYQTTGDRLSYNQTTGRYESGTIQYSEKNKGKFLIRETKNPDGYEGEWSREIQLTKNPQTFSFRVTNRRKLPGTGTVVITKKIRAEEIVWAHGYPVFQFSVSGSDEAGLPHEYCGSIRFHPDQLQVDADGYAYVSRKFYNVVYGSYQIRELPTLRYYLSDLVGVSGNVTVTRLNTPAYGLKPEEVAVARTVLSAQTPQTEVLFVNQKQRNDRYSHTSYVSNRIPVVW